jgi:hypothetical protein
MEYYSTKPKVKISLGEKIYRADIGEKIVIPVLNKKAAYRVMTSAKSLAHRKKRKINTQISVAVAIDLSVHVFVSISVVK